MKKSLIYTLLLGATLLAGSSCKQEIDDIWDQSAAERLDAALKDYSEVLRSAPNGWVMQYFATDEYPGVTMLVKYNNDGSVDFAGKNLLTNDEYLFHKSVFEMIADNGPVLTHNSWNDVLHPWSSPEDIAATDPSEQGVGYGGDYEFIVMSATKDKVRLKGKKRGFDIILTPLAQGRDWEAYFTDIDDLKSDMFSSKIDTLIMHTPNQDYTIVGLNTLSFGIYPSDGDWVTQTTECVGLVDDKGIRLCVPYTGVDEEIKVQNFKYEGTRLVCTDEGATDIYITSNTPGYMFLSRQLKWKIDLESFTGNYKTLYDNFIAGIAARYKTALKLSSITLNYGRFIDSGNNKEDYGYLFTFRFTRGDPANIVVIPSRNGETVTFANANRQDKMGENFATYITGFKEMVEGLCGTALQVSSKSEIKNDVLDITSSNGNFSVSAE